MDISKIRRYDLSRKPIPTRWYLRPLTYLFSIGDVKKHEAKITYTGTENLKPPYLMLCNHNAFMDFKVATKAIYPHRANYVIAIDGFLGRDWLLRNVGGICTRKFVTDMTLVRNLLEVAKNGDIAIMYPEARYSLCGTTAVLPEALGKLCKLLKIPVVTFMCHGHHVNSPFWNLHERGVKGIEAELKLIYTPEELKNASVDDINERLVKEFQYDDFDWQRQKGIRVSYEGRAEGLHKVLYQCPHCKTEYQMDSKGTKLFCKACGKTWTLTELNQLSADEGETEFSHIPDWYEWERANVAKEVADGTYSSGELPVHVMALPNADKFIHYGDGTMIHDMNGFCVRGKDKDGEPFEMLRPVSTMYSCHIEYEYLGKYGDLVDLNSADDTWYVHPLCDGFAVTKMALATEELYFAYLREQGKTVKPGLA